MVAIALTAEAFFKTAPRALGQDRSCTASTSPRTNSASRANLREAVHVGSVRLGTCSKDPIGYLDGTNLYSNYSGLAKLDPTGTTITVEGEIEDRLELIGRLNALCPDAGGFTQASGNIQPVNPNFCKRPPIYVPALSCSFPGSKPSPAEASKHPISCTCICKAISHFRHYRILPRTTIDGRPKDGGITIYPKRQPYEPDVVIIKGGAERPDGYSGDVPGGRVPAPTHITLGHELCGHAVPADFDEDSDGPVDIENKIRDEHGIPRRDGKDHGGGLH